MAIRKVARLGHPVLRQVARQVPTAQITGPETKQLVRDLCETMIEYEGVGLAAPQVFESTRVFVMYAGGETSEGQAPAPTVWINPEIKPLDTGLEQGWEGCLSIPDLRGLVPRHPRIEISGYDADGQHRRVEYEGFPAVVAQHEFDHLEGIVFLDRMDDFRTLAFLKEHERYWLPREDDDES
jgi:peptide deformylase